jgi:hypothetical protein
MLFNKKAKAPLNKDTLRQSRRAQYAIGTDYGLEEEDVFCPSDAFFAQEEDDSGTVSTASDGPTSLPTAAPTPAPTVSMEDTVAAWDMNDDGYIDCSEYNKHHQPNEIPCEQFEEAFGSSNLTHAEMVAALQNFF